MWNKLVEFAQEPSARRLLLALFVSIILHGLLFGRLDLSLPFLKKDVQLIEAHLESRTESAKPLAKPAPAPLEPAAKPAPKPKTKKQANPKAEQPPEPKPESPAPTEAINEPPPAPVNETSEPAPSEPNVEPIAEDSGVVLNENPYPYVETTFDVRTKVGGPVEGKAKALFRAVDSTHYQLSFVVEVQGLAGMFLPNLVQSSDGLIGKTGLQPLNYVYQFGDKPSKNRKAVFDWQAKTLQLTSNNETTTEALPDNSQDVISFMYQFMYVAPLQNMELNITNGKKIREYDYAFEGEEVMKMPFGEFKTYHIVHTGTETDEKIELWLAEEHQYIPVKILKIEKSGKLYEFTATSVATTRPALP